MSTAAVARRYARAVFELARDENSLPAVLRELRAFAAAYHASADFRHLDRMPNMTDEGRQAVVAALSRKLQASELTTRTIDLLARRQRLAVLPELVRQLQLLSDQHLGILRADVRAADKLSAAYLKRLQKTMEASTGRRVEISFEQDPSLIAGVVTTVGDTVIDGSLRGKLARLSASLQQN